MIMDGLSSTGMPDALSQQVAIAMQKKSMQLEQESAQAMLGALPQPAASVNPPHLGQNIDTRV